MEFVDLVIDGNSSLENEIKLNSLVFSRAKPSVLILSWAWLLYEVDV